MKTKEMLALQKRIGDYIRQLQAMLDGSLDSRMVIGHPDVCLYLSRWWKFGWRYLIKIGARKGHLCLSFGPIRATVAW